MPHMTAHVEREITLSPQDLYTGAFKSRLAQAHLCMKDYQKAYEYAEDALRHPATHWPTVSYKVSALGHLGRQAGAEVALKDLLRRKPDLTISEVRSGQVNTHVGLNFVEDYIDGLRKAGLPE